MTYGKAYRPSTPINLVLEHKYQNVWIEDHIRRSHRCKYEREKLETREISHVRLNRATLLRTHQVPVEKDDLWKMPRFAKKALPHLNTFANDKVKDDAYEANEFERIGRLGINGGGIAVTSYE